MPTMNLKYTYTSSDDVIAKCVKRRSAFNIFNKVLVTPNESADFARAQMLQRKGLGGTTIFITLAQEAALNASFTDGYHYSSTTAGTEYINKCPFVYKRKTVLPLSNKF